MKGNALIFSTTLYPQIWRKRLKITDREGVELGAELSRIGYAGFLPATGKKVQAVLEAHIEQGPILENHQKSIGIVTGVQGIKWYNLTLVGEAVHAGPTPMNNRCDPVLGMTQIFSNLFKLFTSEDSSTRMTVGQIEARPGVINTVPAQIRASIDIRHPDQLTLEKLSRLLRDIVESECRNLGLRWVLEELWDASAVHFDPECINVVRNSALLLECQNMDIVSGAGHDAVYLSRVAPTGMIFIPCEKGISHNETENISKNDAILGGNVLLHALLSLAKPISS